MFVIALPLVALIAENPMAVLLVTLMALFAGAAMGVVTWGLVLEARSNGELRQREVAA
jgi:hypothetical protein